MTETLYLVYPDGAGHFEPQPVQVEDHPEGTRFYLSQANAERYSALELGQFA